MTAKEVVIRCSDGLTVRGKVNIGDHYGRIVDWLSIPDIPFITVFEATSDANLGDVIIVNKKHIIWAAPIGK